MAHRSANPSSRSFCVALRSGSTLPTRAERRLTAAALPAPVRARATNLGVGRGNSPQLATEEAGAPRASVSDVPRLRGYRAGIGSAFGVAESTFYYGKNPCGQ